MFEYTVTAAHRTKEKGYIDVYITRDSWQMEQKLDHPVTWNDLEEKPICHWVPDTYPTPIQKGGPMEAYSTFSIIEKLKFFSIFYLLILLFLSSVHNSS